MVKQTDDSRPQTFRITVVPISDHITTENMMPKLRLLFGGIGIKINELERVDDQAGQDGE